MPRKPNMQDVATAAGVSLMAVSYALRNHPSIPSGTAERIKRIAHELGYLSNPLVSALLTQIRSRRETNAAPIIAYLTGYADNNTWKTNPTHSEYFRGAGRRCEELGFRLEHFELNSSSLSGRRLSEVMRYRNVQGIICSPMPRVGMVHPIEWSYFSCCALGYSMPEPAVHRVTNHHYQSARLALERLQALGYRRLGFVTVSLSSDRIFGNFLAAVDSYNRGIPVQRQVPPWVAGLRNRNPAGMEKWLKKYRPDAILGESDIPLRWARTLGYRVPEEIGFATLGWHTPLSLQAGINQNSEQVGAAAVDVVVEQIYQNLRGVPAFQKVILVNGTWMDGPTAPRRR